MQRAHFNLALSLQPGEAKLRNRSIMVLLLGASGYVGQAFARELRRRACGFIPLTRQALDYTQFELLFDYVRRAKPRFLINAAGYTRRLGSHPSDSARTQAVQANAIFPQTVARVCLMTNTPWGHVSSGCIYAGAKILQNGAARVERDLSRPKVQRLVAEQPNRVHGFSETDEPNFSFRSPPCSFDSGSKALAEEVLRGFSRAYLWRPRLAFDQFDHPRNFLSRLQLAPRASKHLNSLSHLGDFVRACLDLWELNAPFGTYNIVNPGAVTTSQVLELINRYLKPAPKSCVWIQDLHDNEPETAAPQSHCILDGTKLFRAGVKLRRVEAALAEALQHWQPAAWPVAVTEPAPQPEPVIDFQLARLEHDPAFNINTARALLK